MANQSLRFGRIRGEGRIEYRLLVLFVDLDALDRVGGGDTVAACPFVQPIQFGLGRQGESLAPVKFDGREQPHDVLAALTELSHCRFQIGVSHV